MHAKVFTQTVSIAMNLKKYLFPAILKAFINA